MKTIIMLLVILFTANTLFAQFMLVKNIYGETVPHKISRTEKITFGTPPSYSKCGDFVLYEGKYYGTVEIGTQCWMKENLNVGTLINGSSGGTNSDGEQTNNSTLEKYCWANAESFCDTYGGLYQWDEAMQYVTGTQGICPTDWHIPTKTELEACSTAVSGSSNALKAVGQGSGGGAGTNTSGFSALLAGNRTPSGGFQLLGGYTLFWSSLQFSSTNAYILYLENNDNITLPNYGKDYGFSVRCLKD